MSWRTFFIIFVRIVLALLASFYILIHRQDFETINRFVHDPRFYLAWGLSFPFVYGLVYLINRATAFLEKKYGWTRHNLGNRLLYQLLLGVVLVIILEFIFIGLYALVMGDNFGLEHFITMDLPAIIMYIVIVNAAYIIWYMFVTLNSPSKTTPKLKVDYDRVVVTLDVINDILYFYKVGNVVTVVTKNKKYGVTKESLESMEKEYAQYGFLRINRGTILNLKNVRGYRSHPEKTGVLLPDFIDLTLISAPSEKVFEISKKNQIAFKKVFE